MTQITSQYSIQRYTGRNDLDLFNPPTGGGSGSSISADLTSQWYKLVDNTLAIHATQSSTKHIPVYYTDIDPKDSSSRVPHPDSTLKELTSGHAYYFVMRSQADLPITIPEDGGKLQSCDVSDCSKIEIEPLPDLNLVGKSNNKQFITVCVSGLTCGETYKFEFSAALSNWPTYVNPIYGEFVATKEKMEIPAEITFSKETGNLDQTNLLDYKIYDDVDYHPCKTEDFNVYSAIKVNVDPISFRGLGAEDLFKIHCIDCLPDCEPYATIKFMDAPVKQVSVECCQQTQNLVIDVRNARLGELYDYKFITDSRHPISISPPTGTVSFGKYFAPKASDCQIQDDAGGQFNTLFNLMSNTEAVLKVELTHRNSQIMTSDYLTVVCSGCT